MRKPYGLGNRSVHEPSQNSLTKISNIKFDYAVSLVHLKDLAKKLPDASRARELILAMADSMPRWVALGQLLLIDKVLNDDDLKER